MSEIKQRNSSVELLKIFGMLLIVISHIALTMNGITDEITKEALFHISYASTDINSIILRVFAYGGYVGNAIFFTCSSWFLCNTKELKKEKIWQMITDIWFISVIIAVIYFLSPVNVAFSYLIRSLFPNILGNNWYTTCYLLFYAFAPILNKALDATDRQQYERIVITLTLLYFGIGFVLPKNFETNYLIMFFVIHIIVFYIRKFREDIYKNMKLNLLILCVSVLCLLLLISVLNFIGLKVRLLESKMMWFGNLQNPFIVLIALSSLMTFLNNSFNSKLINRISSLSLFIYVMHENSIFAAYTRHDIGAYLLNLLGKNNVILITILFALALFIITMIIAFIYQKTIMKLTRKISQRISNTYDLLVDRLIKLTNKNS